MTTAHQTIEQLFDTLEGREDAGNWDELDYDNGIISIEGSSGTYIINAHGPTGQVWVSSPLSGAHHFEYTGNWVSTKDVTLGLIQLLERELFI